MDKPISYNTVKKNKSLDGFLNTEEENDSESDTTE